MDLIPNLDYIDVTNQLLKRCGSKIRIQHLAECTVEVFADIYRGLFHRLPPDYIQYPSGLQDRIHNCQLLIDSLAKDILKTDLSHISGEEIARGSLTRVQFLLEIYFGLKECYLDWKKPHNIEGIDFDSDTESVDSNGLDDIGKSIIKTVIEQELENDSSDFEKENINQKLISRDFMNDNVRSNSLDTSKAASSKFHTKIFRKHYLHESVTSDQDSSDSDSTYDLITQVAVANDAISSTDSLNDDDLRQEVDNVTTPKLDIAHHKVNRKKINKISGDYDDKARKLDDFQVLDEYYSLLSSQNDSDLILQSSLSSHSLTPESSESNSLDEKIETAINIQRENWSKSIENKYDNANPVGAKLGGLMDGDKSCEKGSISNRISNNKSFGDDERLTRLDNTDGNKVEKASYTSVISHHTGDKTDRQHEYRQTVIDSQLAKNKNDYSDMLLTETKPPPETKELKDYQSKNANSGDEVQRNSIFESSSELSSKNHDSSHLNTTDNNRYKKLATADTKLYKTENYRNALIEKNDSKKRYQNLEIDIKDLKNNITNISEKASCSDDYSETNPNEVGNNAELNQDKYAQLKETLRNLREQRSTFPSQPISTEEPLVDSYSRNPSVRFADYVRDRSLEEFDGSLSNEEKYFSNTNNTKIVDRKYRYDEVKSGPTRKQSKRRDINDETAKDLIQKIRNRNVLQTKEVQRQLEREKQIERLCLELLKSSYQHELEDLSLERKEEITATKKVAFKNKNDKNKKKQKHHPKSKGTLVSRQNLTPSTETIYTSKASVYPSSLGGRQGKFRKEKLNVSLPDKKVMSRVESELPHSSVSSNTKKVLREKQLHHYNFQLESERELKGGYMHPETRAQIIEAQKKQQAMVNIMKKDIRLNRRLRDYKERCRSEQAMKSQIHNNRISSALARRYYQDYVVNHRAKMQKRRTKEEKIFKDTFEEALKIQKEYLQYMTKYTKEQREIHAKQRRNELESLENYYRDQFAMLSEKVSRQKDELKIKEKEHNRLVDDMRRKLKSKLKSEIEELQDVITRDSESTHYRQLDGERLLQLLHHAQYY